MASTGARTVEDALQLAQRVEPLDLVKRVDFIEMKRDTCDIDDLPAWNAALDLTRNGIERDRG